MLEFKTYKGEIITLTNKVKKDLITFLKEAFGYLNPTDEDLVYCGNNLTCAKNLISRFNRK